MCHFPSVRVGLPAAGRRQRLSHSGDLFMKMKIITSKLADEVAGGPAG
jgi:hypothetical protein